MNVLNREERRNEIGKEMTKGMMRVKGKENGRERQMIIVVESFASSFVGGERKYEKGG